MRCGSSGDDYRADDHQLAVALCASLRVTFMVELHVDCLLLAVDRQAILAGESSAALSIATSAAGASSTGFDVDADEADFDDLRLWTAPSMFCNISRDAGSVLSAK